MRRLRDAVLCGLGLGSVLGLAGCMGAASLSLTQPVTMPTSVIFVSPPPTTLAINAKATLMASAIYPLNVGLGSVSTQVTWTVTCGSAGACGTFSANSDVEAVTYTAPAAVPAGGSVTVTATSVADSALSRSATIAITPPIPISVTFFAVPPAYLQVGATFPLRAAIQNDVSANPQVQWSVSCGGSSCGSFGPATTTNQATATYTAPPAIPSGGNVTVTATSVTDPTKSVSATIGLIAAGPSLANGTYVFQVTGQLSAILGNGASFMTGVVVAKNGAITGGEQDWISYESDANGDLYPYSTFQTIAGGSYATTADGNLAMNIQVGAGQVETVTGTLAAGGQGFVAGLDGATVNGSLDLQTSTSAPSGGYALVLGGGDKYASPAWMGGVVNIDSPGGISGSGSVLDVLYSGVGLPGGTTGKQSLGAGTVSAPDAFGRVVFQLNPATTSTLQPLSLAGYIIDTSHIRLIEVDAPPGTLPGFQGVLGGTALGQGARAGQFSAASLGGSSYVFGAEGDDAHGALQLVGVFTTAANGTASGLLNWNDLTGAVGQNPQPFTGTYTVDPTGRVTLSNLIGSTFGYSLHLYLGAGGGLMLSSDSADIFTGQAFQQQGTPFTANSLSGTYGLNATLGTANYPYSGPAPVGAMGPMTSTPNGGSDPLSGFADVGTGAGDFAISGSVTAAPNGVFTGTLAGFNPASRTTAGDFSLYMVDPTQGILIETDNTGLTLGRMLLVH